MDLSRHFALVPQPSVEAVEHFPLPGVRNPLGALLGLVGTWEGHGFNTIWRPHHPKDPQDRFLELNLTTETLQFDTIPGQIPNRGLNQPEMAMCGLHYLQQISDTTTGNGLHVEPGIWATVPSTVSPAEPSTVVRMASIPHGTTVLAQGLATSQVGAPTIPETDIIPFGLNGAPPAKGTFAQARATFTELDLTVTSPFRLPSDASTVPGITKALVADPNKLLRDALVGQDIRHTTRLHVTTTASPVPGGGTANTVFLAGTPDTAQPGGPDTPTPPNANANANAALVTATFWIETVADPHGGADTRQLQYSQTVMLDFNGLRWPHVSVATLVQRLPVTVPMQSIDPQFPLRSR